MSKATASNKLPTGVRPMMPKQVEDSARSSLDTQPLNANDSKRMREFFACASENLCGWQE